MVWLFAMVAASCAAAASGLRLYRVRTALKLSPAELARRLGRSAGADRLRGVAAEVRASGAIWEAELLDDILGATSDAARVAFANEHLEDLAARLDWGSRIPIAAARLSIAAPLCAVFFVLARGGLVWSAMLLPLACSGVGAVASLWAGRRADKAAAGLREGVDMLVDRALRAASLEPYPGGDSQ